MKKRNSARILASIGLALLVGLIFVNDSFAQSDSRGTDFWVCFPQNAKPENNSQLTFGINITGDQATTGTVSIPGLHLRKEFSFAASQMISFDLDTSVQVLSSGKVEDLGIHIQSDRPVAVYGLSNRKASTDSYVAFPTMILGTAYRAMGYGKLNAGAYEFTSQMTFVATEDATEVQVVLSADTKDGKRVGETIKVRLNKGQLYQLQSTTQSGSSGDLTGSLVTSNKPIAFFTGHICAQVPLTVNFCDQLLEEEAPINTWGKQFFLGKMFGKHEYVIRVLADENDTKIFLNAKYVETLRAGEYYENSHLRENAIIASDRPILVGQYATSSEDDSVKVGDPFLILIVPTEQFMNSYRFVTPIGGDSISRQKRIALKSKADSKLGKIDIKKSIKLIERPHDTSRSSSSIFVSDTILPVPQVKCRSVNNEANRSRISGWQHFINVIVSDDAINSIVLDGKGLATQGFTKLGQTGYSVGTYEIPFGQHVITSTKPFGLYSYGFGTGWDDYDSYGNSVGQKFVSLNSSTDLTNEIGVSAQFAHETYPLEINPSPAKYGQSVNIAFTNSMAEQIGVDVLDKTGTRIAELQRKQFTDAGKHTLIFDSGKFIGGDFFVRLNAYSIGGQILHQQDAHFVVNP